MEYSSASLIQASDTIERVIEVLHIPVATYNVIHTSSTRASDAMFAGTTVLKVEKELGTN